MSEYNLQVAVVEHIRNTFPSLSFFHVPNQNKDATQAFFNKQMGVKAGVSDIILTWAHTAGNFDARPVYMGAIELKYDKGRISRHQNIFISHMASIGWYHAVCYSVAEVHETLKSWGHIPKSEFIKEPSHLTKREKKDAAKAFVHEMWKRK